MAYSQQQIKDIITSLEKQKAAATDPNLISSLELSIREWKKQLSTGKGERVAGFLGKTTGALFDTGLDMLSLFNGPAQSKPDELLYGEVSKKGEKVGRWLGRKIEGALRKR